jgi:energy-coupling factor transporter ATP-binding protein EcfA2
MKKITGLIGRGDLVKGVLSEIRKGKHVLLSGPIGVGKSAVLEEAARTLERRESGRLQLDPLQDSSAPSLPTVPPKGERRRAQKFVIVYLHDHNAKSQFVAIARRLMETGLVKPSELDLPKKLDELPPEEIEWNSVKRSVNRLSMKDLADAVIPAINQFRKTGKGRVIVFVDDMTRLTPTQQAFWLAVFEQAQVVACASAKKDGLRKLWWKFKEISVPPLSPEASKAAVREYIERKGTMIESPALYVSHVVKQSGGNPQAIYDMVDESAKERVVEKHKIREMRHAAGIRYVDFSPVMLVGIAMVIGSRYMAIGLGDKALYILAGMSAAILLTVKMFVFKGAGRAN